MTLCSFSESLQEISVPVRYQGRRGKILITNMTGETNMNMDQCQLSERTVLEPYEAKVILYEYL